MGERVDLEREKRFLAAHAAAHDRIYRYFRRRTDGAATAQDLSAEVFRIVWEKSGHGDDLSVIVLFGVARNVLRNHDRLCPGLPGSSEPCGWSASMELPKRDPPSVMASTA
jgi:RNA polymerase sigma-70 factor (ECF subfamily)